jgi:hypothetical protein
MFTNWPSANGAGGVSGVLGCSRPFALAWSRFSVRGSLFDPFNIDDERDAAVADYRRLNVAASTNPASPAISPASSTVTKSSTACSAGDVSASTSGDWIYLFLKIALRIELFEIRPQVLGRLFVLNPSEYHFGARNFRFRILDVFLESRRLPVENE